MQALNQLNIKAKAFTSEILNEALRVTETRHPNDTRLGYLTNITDKQLDHVASSAKSCGHVLFAAGTPCLDNTELKGTQRKGLGGPKSYLFHQVAKILTRLEERLQQSSTQLYTLIENVTGTSEDDCNTIATTIETRHPVHVDAKETSWAARDRLWWLSWRLTKRTGEELVPGTRGLKLTKWGVRARPETIVGTQWQPGGSQLPCLTRPQRAMWGQSFRIAGHKQADKSTIQRWKQDGKRHAPYRYKAQSVLWNNAGNLKLPTVEEQELLMGYPMGYTQDEKHHNDDHTREQLLSNTMHVDTLKRILLDAPFATKQQQGTPRYQGQPQVPKPGPPTSQLIVNSIQHFADMIKLDNDNKVQDATTDTIDVREIVAQGKPDTSDARDYNARHETTEAVADKNHRGHTTK